MFDQAQAALGLAQTLVKQSEAALRTATLNLSYTTLRAPSKGVVPRRRPLRLHPPGDRGRVVVSAADRQRDSATSDARAARLKTAADARISHYQWVRGRGQKIGAEQSLEQLKG